MVAKKEITNWATQITWNWEKGKNKSNFGVANNGITELIYFSQTPGLHNALVELPHWQDSDWSKMVVPWILLKSKIQIFQLIITKQREISEHGVV